MLPFEMHVCITTYAVGAAHQQMLCASQLQALMLPGAAHLPSLPVQYPANAATFTAQNWSAYHCYR